MKKFCFFATMLLAAVSMNAQPESRQMAWVQPEFVEAEWTHIGTGNVVPGVADYFPNEYKDMLDAEVYASKVTPGDYWFQPETSFLNIEECLFPGPFIVHMQNTDAVYTDPVWCQHPMIFAFFQRVPEIMGLKGSKNFYGKYEDGVVTFPANSYIWGSNPTSEPVTNLNGDFSVIFPDESGINDVAVDAQAPVYYNLQGVQVANPQHGVYIIKAGSKVSKVKF